MLSARDGTAMRTEEESQDGKIKRSRPKKWTKVVTFHVPSPATPSNQGEHVYQLDSQLPCDGLSTLKVPSPVRLFRKYLT